MADKPLIVMLSVDVMMVGIYKRMLERDGFILKHVQKSEKAFKILKEKKAFALLLDMAIPGEDGFDLIKQLRKYQKLKDIPVVVLSHLGSEADVKRARKLGVKEYCLKMHCHPERIVGRLAQMREN